MSTRFWTNPGKLAGLDQIAAGSGIILGLGLLFVPFLFTHTNMSENFGFRYLFPRICALPVLAVVGLPGWGSLSIRRLMITASLLVGIAVWGYYLFRMYVGTIPFFD